MPKQVTFNDTVCDVTIAQYQNGRKAIELTEQSTGEPWIMASVNIPTIPLAEDEVIIKDYSENEGIFKVLCDAKIIEDTGRKAPSGYVTCPIGRILVQ